MTTISACLYAAQIIERSGLGERVDGLHDSADNLIYTLRLAARREIALREAEQQIPAVQADPELLRTVIETCESAGVQW